MQLQFFQKELQLKETFSIAYGNYDKRDALLVQLSHLDKKGFGECVSINYYGINLNEFILKLNEIQPQIEAQKIINPKDFFSFLLNLNLHPFLLSALDCAYWDLFGKLENKSFAELNSLENKNVVESSITISIAEIDDQIQKIEKSNWNQFKVKCNGFRQENFEKLISLNGKIALDSNAGFTENNRI